MRGDGKDRGGPERFGFLATVMGKLEGVLPPDPDRLTRWQEGYARARSVIHSEVFNEGEIDGVRAMLVQGLQREVAFVAIRQDGACVFGATPYMGAQDMLGAYAPPVQLDDRTASLAFARVAWAVSQGDRPQDADMARVEPWGLDWERTGPSKSLAFAFDTRGRDFQNQQVMVAESVLRATLGSDWQAGEGGIPVADLALDPDEDEVAFEENDPDKVVFHRLRHTLRAPILAQQRKAGKFGVHLLVKEAEPEALRRMRAIADPSVEAYNHLVGVPLSIRQDASGALPSSTPQDAFGVVFDDDGVMDAVDVNAPPSVLFAGAFPPVSGMLAERRRQALDLYPILARTTLGSSKDKSPEIVEAIDAGRPFEAQLAKSMSVPPSVLRRLRGVNWQKAGRDFYYDGASTILPMAAGVAPEHMPTNRTGFRALKASIEAAHGYREAFSDSPKSVVDIVAGMSGRFERANAWRDNADPRGAKDAAEYVVNRVVRPMIHQEALAAGQDKTTAHRLASEVSVSGRNVLDDVFGHSSEPSYPGFWPLGQDPGIRRAGEVSHAWHRALPRLEVDLVDPAHRSTQVWEPWFEQKDLGQGWTAREVRDAPTMGMLGVLENTCVGGYAPRAEEGHCIIVELLHNGERMSVAEVATSDNPKDWKIRQNQAHSNTDPGKAAHGAANRGAANHRRVLEENKDPDSVLARTIGRSPTDRAGTDQAFDALRPYLDKRWSKMDAGAFRAQVIQPFVGRMVEAEASFLRAQEAAAARRAAAHQAEQDRPYHPAPAVARPRGWLDRVAEAARGFGR